MIDEFNKQAYVNDTARETESFQEQRKFGENTLPKEISDYEEVSPPAKKSPSGLGKLLPTLTAATAALVFAVAIAPAITGGDKTVVNFAELGVTDTSISYYVSLENRSDDELRLVVYNDFTERSQTIEGDAIAGEETGLKPGMFYTLSVKNGNKTIAEMRLRTKKTEEMPVTIFRTVTHECTCDVDGMFHFQMDFTDENGYWYNFRATLTDEFGTMSVCEFSDDLHGKQSIAVSDAGLLGKSAIFEITCSSWEGSDSDTVLYRTTVQI